MCTDSKVIRSEVPRLVARIETESPISYHAIAYVPHPNLRFKYFPVMRCQQEDDLEIPKSQKICLRCIHGSGKLP